MARVTGAAKTLTLAGVPIEGMTKYDFKAKANNEVVKVLTDGWANRVGATKGWEISVEFE